MLRPQLFLTLSLVLGCLFHHVSGVKENPTPECGEDEYQSADGSECHPCQELTCEAGFEPNLSCGGGNPLTGAACTKCQDGYFSNAGQNCQRCSLCRNTVNDIPCTRERDIECGDCKRGYVFLGYHCRSCNQVPYPSRYEQCREEEPPSDIEEEPVPHTVVESAKMTSPEEEKGPGLPWNSLLVLIILAGLILLVALVIILGIVFCCHYKRNGHCGGACSSPQDIESDGQEGDRQIERAQGQVPDSDRECVEVDPLLQDNRIDIQPNPRPQANGPSDAHPSGGLVRDTPLGEGNDPCNGQIPTGEETSVDIDDKCNRQYESLQHTANESNDELRNRQSYSRSNSGCSPSFQPFEGRSNPQDHTSNQSCQGCSRRTEVHIGTASTVNFVTYNGGHHLPHPPSPADDIKYNPDFNPSDKY